MINIPLLDPTLAEIATFTGGLTQPVALKLFDKTRPLFFQRGI